MSETLHVDIVTAVHSKPPSSRLALGMTVCLQLVTETFGRSWSEQVLPYGLVVTIAPSRWSLTEASREIRLPPSPVSGTAV